MDIVTLGELLIDMFPSQADRRIGEVEAFIPKPGGAPANVAVAARRLGATSAFIGKVGDDPFGHSLKGVLEKERVETRGMRFDPEARTTMALIGVPSADSAEFVFYRNPGADQRLKPDELDQGLLLETKAFHFGSVSLTDEPARSATIEAVEIVRSTDALISYDVNYRPSLWSNPDQALEMALSLLPRVHLLKLNETEAALLAGIEGRGSVDQRDLEEAAGELVSRGPEVVLITLGANGSYYQTREGGGFMPPFKVRSVDSVGCGDAFSAGILVGLVAGGRWQANLDLPRLRGIVRYANAVGALTSLVRGVIPALPTAAQVEDFLEKYDPE